MHHFRLPAAVLLLLAVSLGCSTEGEEALDAAREQASEQGLQDAFDDVEEEPTPVEPQASPTPTRPTPPPAPPSLTAPSPPPAALTYFQALATGDPDEMQAMLDAAAPSSPAHTYATIQIARARANRDHGFPSEPHEVEVTPDGVKLCSVYGEEADCDSFTALAVSDGNLTEFFLSDIPIAERVRPGGQVVQDGPVTITVHGAYHSPASNNLIVPFDMTSSEPVSVAINATEYVGPDGRQAQASGTGPVQLRAGATATMYASVEGGALGGTIYVVATSEDYQRQWELALPTTA
jgi:hypothetical protein